MEADPPPSKLADRLSKWNSRHPVLSLLLVSLLAVVVNCHPIIFLGRSMVSPACADLKRQIWAPFVSGLETNQIVSEHGSDVWATMIWGIPAGFIESRSLLQHGELPLWNRYGHAGSTFLGQAVTMFGDPLQLIVIIGRGSALAWDIKFLVAKFLFCTGFGLLCWRILRSQKLALVMSALSAYCGAFFYINNHLVFFVFCYAPWILLSGMHWLDAQNKHHFRWFLAWLLANFACFNAGHVEVAVIVVFGLNLVAMAHASVMGWAEVLTALKRMSLGTLIFLGITTPVWLSFVGSLAGSYSAHMETEVIQLPFRSLPGAFDDIFYRLPRQDRIALAPGTSFLVLAGCILSVLHWRQLKAEPFFWINIGAIGLWGGCIFGWIPNSLLNCIPFLNQDGHTFTDFSYLLVIHLTLQCAFGFKTLAMAATDKRALVRLAGITLVIAGMLLWYNYGVHHPPMPWGYIVVVTVGAVGAPVLFTILKAHNRSLSVVGWLVVLLLGMVAQHRFGLYAFGNKDQLLLVGPRLRLDAPSPSIERIKQDRVEPFRVVGMNNCLTGDYAAVYELEDIRSCMPLTSVEYINLVRNFPGMQFKPPWYLNMTSVVDAKPLLNLLNVKYLLCSKKINDPPDVGLRLVERSDYAVVENQNVWPRAFFTDKLVCTDTLDEFIGNLRDNGKQPFAALTSEEIRSQPGLQSLETTAQATVLPATNYLLSVNSTAFDIHAPTAGLICLTEGQARGFMGAVNGRSMPILTVNRAFKALYVDHPGDYHVVFTYRPWHWRFACIVFWLTIGGLAGWVIMRFYRGKRKLDTRVCIHG